MRYLSSYAEAMDNFFDSSKLLESDWSYVTEPVGISKSDPFTETGLLEQLNTTADSSDYLWYSISIEVNGDEPFLFNGTQSNLHVDSLGHVLHVFVNGNLSGSGKGSSSNEKVSLELPILLVTGNNTIDLLSATVGLQNYGVFFDLWGAGVTGPVRLSSPNTTVDLSSKEWTYQVGLKGEELNLFNAEDSTEWTSDSNLLRNQPLIWYKAKFDSPIGTDPVGIDFTGMGKGEAWVNGQSIGRFWPTYLAPSAGCVGLCNYRGPYGSSKCLKNCGAPSQKLYHVPRSLLQQGSNDLVLFEEVGGDPTKISFATRQTRSLCAHVSEVYPPPVDAWASPQLKVKKARPTLQLECPDPDQVISVVKFASFGTPHGTCGSFSHGQCSSPSALEVVQEACVGARRCSVGVSIEVFGDPCKRVTKSLAVEATCS